MDRCTRQFNTLSRFWNILLFAKPQAFSTGLVNEFGLSDCFRRAYGTFIERASKFLWQKYWPSSRSIIKDTVVPRSQARISHAPKYLIYLLNKVTRLRNIKARDCQDSSEHLTSFSHISSHREGKCWLYVMVFGFEEVPGEFQLAESPRMASHWWLTMVWPWFIYDWPWFIYHK